MRVGVLLFHPNKGQYGGAQLPTIDIVNILREAKLNGVDVDPELVLFNGRGTAYRSTWVESDVPHRVIPKKNAGTHLKEHYDFLISIIPGEMKAHPESYSIKLFEESGLPFVIRFAAEYENKLYPNAGPILNSPNLKGIFTTSTSLEGGNTVQIEPMIDPKLLKLNTNLEETLRNKENKIISTSRWVSWKNVRSLAEASPVIHEETYDDWDIDVYGDSPFFAEVEAMKQTNPDSWNNRGFAFRDYLDCEYKKAKILWNPSRKWRLSRDQEACRFDYTVHESAFHGVVPVLNENMIPDWLHTEFNMANISNGSFIIPSHVKKSEITEWVSDAMIPVMNRPNDMWDRALWWHHAMLKHYNLENVTQKLLKLIGATPVSEGK